MRAGSNTRFEQVRAQRNTSSISSIISVGPDESSCF
jgi:hypothetical protein